MTIMNRSKMNLPREYFLGLRLRVIVIPFKSVVVFGGSEKRREPLVILPEPLVILQEPLVILSEPRPRFHLRVQSSPLSFQPPLELSDLVLRFEQLFVLEFVLAHPVVTRICICGGIRFELSDLVLRFA